MGSSDGFLPAAGFHRFVRLISSGTVPCSSCADQKEDTYYYVALCSYSFGSRVHSWLGELLHRSGGTI